MVHPGAEFAGQRSCQFVLRQDSSPSSDATAASSARIRMKWACYVCNGMALGACVQFTLRLRAMSTHETTAKMGM